LLSRNEDSIRKAIEDSRPSIVGTDVPGSLDLAHS